MLVCLFGICHPTWEFSIWRRHHYLWRTTNFDPYSALMTIEQWEFFRLTHLLWHGASVYNDHLRRPVTLEPIAERLAVELSIYKMISPCFMSNITKCTIIYALYPKQTYKIKIEDIYLSYSVVFWLDWLCMDLF